MMKINLLKQAKKTVTQKELTIYKQLAIGGAILVVIIVVLVLLEVSIKSKIAATQNNIAQLNQKLVQLNKVVDEINNFKKMKDQIKAKLDIINSLETNRLAEVHLMDELSKCIPYDPTTVLSKKLWLVSMQQHGDLIGMDGVALDNATLAQFMDNLSKDPYFSDVNLAKTEQIKSNDLILYKFSLSCKFNPAPGAAVTETTNKTL